MNREFLQLAETYNPDKHYPNGWFLSEKLDGMRCFWDGGASRGMLAYDVPWANTEKHSRFKDDRVVSTGLWTRYGQVIRAPDFWINALPKGMLLDGEMYAGRGRFQFVVSTCKTHIGNENDWSEIRYLVFDSPSVPIVFMDGRINNTNFKKIINQNECFKMFTGFSPVIKNFENTYKYLEAVLKPNDILKLLKQKQLSYMTTEYLKEIETQLDTITSDRGEGLMLRQPESMWYPKRMQHLLKVKRLQDSEGKVVGYISGEKTDKGSKLLGMLGALIVEWNHSTTGKTITFELSGFTDRERLLLGDAAHSWACANPKTRCPNWIECPAFPIGSMVTFRYREETNDGVPKEGRYWRKHVLA